MPNSGLGLYYAKKYIEDTKGAYIIRTNNIELFYSPNYDGSYTEKFAKLPKMTGTLITILIPLD